MLNWGNQFGICCFMNSHSYPDAYRRYDCILAVEAVYVFSPQINILSGLKSFTQQHQDWLFGHISYDVKNEIAGLQSTHPDCLDFPLIFFFQPQTVITIKGNKVVIECIGKIPAGIHQQIQQENIAGHHNKASKIALQSRIDKTAYLTVIKKLQQHILRGDCYEINFCQEFFADNSVINPLQVYRQLVTISPTPFSAYYKLNDKYALCASPERYIRKESDILISQPVKGTIRRNTIDPQDDEALKASLLNSAKNRSENVMIADLV